MTRRKQKLHRRGWGKLDLCPFLLRMNLCPCVVGRGASVCVSVFVVRGAFVCVSVFVGRGASVCVSVLVDSFPKTTAVYQTYIHQTYCGIRGLGIGFVGEAGVTRLPFFPQ